MRFYRLTTNIDMNEVVREHDDGSKDVYVYGEDVWANKNHVMDDIFDSESKDFHKCEVVSEQEAKNQIKKNYILYDKLFSVACVVAELAHRGQLDKGGNPYIEHCINVTEHISNLEWKIIAMLHDVCENTDISFDDLLNFGFTTRIILSVKAITRGENEAYEDYLKRVKADEGALNVKLADLQNNMDITRLRHITEKDFERMEKYKRAYAFLISKQ